MASPLLWPHNRERMARDHKLKIEVINTKMVKLGQEDFSG